jgi:hypothetical protein
MKNPESGGVAEVTEEAFDDLWARKGWVEATQDEYDLQESLSDASVPFDLETAKKSDLIARATALQVEATGTADEIRDRLRALTGGNG